MSARVNTSNSRSRRPGIYIRRAFSVLLGMSLYTVARPFEPSYWLLKSEASLLIDRFVSTIALLCACYFQWAVASLRRPVTVTYPGPGEQPPLFVWRLANFWPCALCEFLLLVVAYCETSEVARRTIVSGLVLGLWLVGLPATPESTKRAIWDEVKREAAEQILHALTARRVGC
ncbi:uncharacterized protein DNG_04060 [Cephalotrichum gorgonifer]|uniref:Uncharacterized protein n=1 Tax=Cephalotrichum gorgonifer TaxID=2041049 RepID=A0AAE8MXQ9_9PEZI|nr:uncharacterized protein DNG_04060 [Cephalotrichum gorgonifer]